MGNRSRSKRTGAKKKQTIATRSSNKRSQQQQEKEQDHEEEQQKHEEEQPEEQQEQKLDEEQQEKQQKQKQKQEEQEEQQEEQHAEEKQEVEQEEKQQQQQQQQEKEQHVQQQVQQQQVEASKESSKQQEEAAGQWISLEEAKARSMGHEEWWTEICPRRNRAVEVKQYDPEGPEDKPIWRWNNGDMYLGEWSVTEEEGGEGGFRKQSGFGVDYCHSQKEFRGSCYVGEFQNGLSDFYGKTFWLESSDTWQENHFPCSPITINTHQTVAETKAEQGKAETERVTTKRGLPFTYVGRFEEGFFRDDAAQVTLKDGTTKIGPWKDGKPVGNWWMEHKDQEQKQIPATYTATATATSTATGTATADSTGAGTCAANPTPAAYPTPAATGSAHSLCEDIISAAQTHPNSNEKPFPVSNHHGSKRLHPQQQQQQLQEQPILSETDVEVEIDIPLEELPSPPHSPPTKRLKKRVIASPLVRKRIAELPLAYRRRHNLGCSNHSISSSRSVEETGHESDQAHSYVHHEEEEKEEEVEEEQEHQTEVKEKEGPPHHHGFTQQQQQQQQQQHPHSLEDHTQTEEDHMQHTHQSALENETTTANNNSNNNNKDETFHEFTRRLLEGDEIIPAFAHHILSEEDMKDEVIHEFTRRLLLEDESKHDDLGHEHINHHQPLLVIGAATKDGSINGKHHESTSVHTQYEQQNNGNCNGHHENDKQPGPGPGIHEKPQPQPPLGEQSQNNKDEPSKDHVQHQKDEDAINNKKSSEPLAECSKDQLAATQKSEPITAPKCGSKQDLVNALLLTELPKRKPKPPEIFDPGYKPRRPKRPQGRPRKEVVPVTPETTNRSKGSKKDETDNSNETNPPKQKRSRGRPKKDGAVGVSSNSPKRRTGRPKKDETISVNGQSSKYGSKRLREDSTEEDKIMPPPKHPRGQPREEGGQTTRDVQSSVSTAPNKNKNVLAAVAAAANVVVGTEVEVTHNSDSDSSVLSHTQGEECNTDEALQQQVQLSLAREIIGDTPSDSDMKIYAAKLHELGFQSKPFILKYCTPELIDSFDWIRFGHKLAFKDWLARNKAKTT